MAEAAFALSGQVAGYSTGSRETEIGREAFLAEAEATLRKVQESCQGLVQSSDPEQVGTLLRHVHTYKSLMSFVGTEPPVRLATPIEEFLSAVWRGQMALNSENIRLISQGVSLLLATHASTIRGLPSPRNEAYLGALQAALARVRRSAPGPEPQGQAASSEAEAPPPLPVLRRGANPDLAEMDALCANLSRLLQRLSDISCTQQDERSQALMAAMRRNVEQLRSTIHEGRFTTVRAFLLPMIATVQSAALHLGKRVSVRLQGENLEVERATLQALQPSIVHLLRNAVAHGIESPARRAEVGKPEVGTILVTCQLEGPYLVISISDDGQGFDTKALREAAVRLGAISQEKADRTSDEDATMLALVPGLSTSAAIDDLSGNGMGLAAVAEDVAALGGQISIDSRPGQGTTISIKLPLTAGAGPASPPAAPYG